MMGTIARVAVADLRRIFMIGLAAAALLQVSPVRAEEVAEARGAATFTKLVDSTTPDPAKPGSILLLGVGNVPAIDDGIVVFNTSDQNVWVTPVAAPKLTRVIHPGMKIPGRTANFHQFDAAQLTIRDGRVVFVGESCGPCAVPVGLYTVPAAGGPVTRLVDIDDTMPGTPGLKYVNFGNDFHVDGATVMFANRQQVWAVPVAGGSVTAVAGERDRGFDPPGPRCCLFYSPTVDDRSGKVLVLEGNFNGGGVFTVDAGGDPRSFRKAAIGSQATPGAPEFGFFSFVSGSVDRDGKALRLVIRALSNRRSPNLNIQGLYAFGPGSQVRLVDTLTRVPGGTGTFQYDPGFPAFAVRGGTVIFQGVDAAHTSALFAVRVTGGPITRLIAVGDKLGGHTVGEIRMRRDGYDGTTLAIAVRYGDMIGAGIYTARIDLQ